MKIEPNCRYGHGLLTKMLNEPVDHRFAFMGVHIPKRRFPIQFGEAIDPVTPSGRVFTVAVFQCPTCGYLEIFDDEVSNG